MRKGAGGFPADCRHLSELHSSRVHHTIDLQAGGHNGQAHHCLSKFRREVRSHPKTLDRSKVAIFVCRSGSGLGQLGCFYDWRMLSNNAERYRFYGQLAQWVCSEAPSGTSATTRLACGSGPDGGFARLSELTNVPVKLFGHQGEAPCSNRTVPGSEARCHQHRPLERWR